VSLAKGHCVTKQIMVKKYLGIKTKPKPEVPVAQYCFWPALQSYSPFFMQETLGVPLASLGTLTTRSAKGRKASSPLNG